jgi:hypothetical protein
MVYFVYADNEERQPFRGRPKPYHEQDAVALWLVHYSNSKYLTFLARNETDVIERNRAVHELSICQKKMDFWKRHVNWDAKRAGSLAQEIDKKWQ